MDEFIEWLLTERNDEKARVANAYQNKDHDPRAKSIYEYGIARVETLQDVFVQLQRRGLTNRRDRF